MPFIPPHPSALRAVSHALSLYRLRTHYPYVPSCNRLRTCPIADHLNLRQLISLAGGHTSVQHHLNLSPPPLPRNESRQREMDTIAADVKLLCAKSKWGGGCPSMRWIRERDPLLANRISAVSGRKGYRVLQQHFVNGPGRDDNMQIQSAVKQRKREWGTWTRPDAIATELSKYQFHPNVMPRLAEVTTQLASAIQRQGGMERYASLNGLILYKNWANVRRFSRLLRWLSRHVGEPDITDEPYLTFIKRQCAHPPTFPNSDQLVTNGMYYDVSRYGGRRSLSMRLGFERRCGYRDVFLGPFSVRYTADVLHFAVEHCLVAEGSVAMPSIAYMRLYERHDLADATELLGGELVVGRRVGLVPLTRSAEGVW